MLYRKRNARRISVWGLIFAMTLLFCSLLTILPVSGAMMDPADGAREAVSDVGGALSDVGGAVSDAGNAVSEALTDMFESDRGEVSDSDGVIGNESEEVTDTDTPEEQTRRIGWIGVIIALAVVAVIITLIIVLIPKRRK